MALSCHNLRQRYHDVKRTAGVARQVDHEVLDRLIGSRRLKRLQHYRDVARVVLVNAWGSTLAASGVVAAPGLQVEGCKVVIETVRCIAHCAVGALAVEHLVAQGLYPSAYALGKFLDAIHDVLAHCRIRGSSGLQILYPRYHTVVGVDCSQGIHIEIQHRVASVVQQRLEVSHAKEVVAHGRRRQQALGLGTRRQALQRLVKAVGLDTALDGRTSRHAIEVVDIEAQLLVAELGHVGRAGGALHDSLRPRQVEGGHLGVVIVSHHLNLLAVIGSVVVIKVAIHRRQCQQRKEHRGAVRAKVDAILLEVEADRGRRRCQVHAVIADVGSAVEVDIGHARADEPH